VELGFCGIRVILMNSTTFHQNNDLRQEYNSKELIVLLRMDFTKNLMSYLNNSSLN
jgi:hypothetical protein